MYMELLEGSSNEDQVVIYLTGLVRDGLCYGNWLWNMPPDAPHAPKSPFESSVRERKVMTTEPRRSGGTGDMGKRQW
jgi:hypothetical protein